MSEKCYFSPTEFLATALPTTNLRFVLINTVHRIQMGDRATWKRSRMSASEANYTLAEKRIPKIAAVSISTQRAP
jgi:hypothetical protein